MNELSFDPRKLTIKTAEVFEPLLYPSRYKGGWGGRGSGKSHFFAGLLIEECCRIAGTRAVCVREIQKTLRESSKAVLEEKINTLGLADQFNVLTDRIETPGGGVILFQGMQDHTAESIKSLEGCRIAWVEEAQTLSQRSLDLLRPTIRIDDSEIWFSWNPRTRKDAVDKFLRADPPDNAVVVKANWRDNPWWNAVLEKERITYAEKNPDSYAHIWEGEYGAVEGAYFSRVLAQAKAQGRIGFCPADPILSYRAFFDIGGAGAKADAMAIWIVQWVGREIRVLDFIEGVGQVLAYYVNELRRRGYEQAVCYLPHDGINTNNITGKRYVDHLTDAGLNAHVIPNQGSGAAMMRVEALRRIFPQMRFNEATTASGIQALSNYHEKVDPNREVGLGPEHDWSSHAADSLGLMACCYVEPFDEEESAAYRSNEGRSSVTGY